MPPPFALHIVTGFLSDGVAMACAAVAAGVLAYCLRTAPRELDDDAVSLLGVVAAFVFAVQMLNFPVAGATSGHLLGATLAAVLLGPRLGCIVLALVLAVQAFVFADGGAGVLGANVLNMGVLGAFLAGFLIRRGPGVGTRERGAFLGRVAVVSWCAVMLGALATSLELALSGTVGLSEVLPQMMGVHALIGVGEAAITVGAIALLMAARAAAPGFAAPSAGPAPGARA